MNTGALGCGGVAGFAVASILVIPFESPAPAGRAAAPPLQLDIERGQPRRIGFARAGACTAHQPALVRRTRARLGIAAQHDDRHARAFGRQHQPPARGQRIFGKAPPARQHHRRQPRTARAFQPGAQHAGAVARYLEQRTAAHEALRSHRVMVLDVTADELPAALVERYLAVKRDGVL